MSGYKRATVSISQDEYDRLRDAEGKLRSLPKPSTESIQMVADQSLDLLRSNLDDIEERQARFQDFLSGIDDTVQGIEKNTNERLQEIEHQAVTQIQNHIGNLRNDYEKLLQDQQKEYEDFALDLHRQQQAQISYYAGEVDQFVQDHNQKEDIARNWLVSCVNFLSYLRDNYAVGFFSPDIFLSFEQQLIQMEANYQNGFFDAVLVASQQVFRELSQYRLDLEKKHNEWNFLYQAAWETVNQELIQVGNSAYVPALDLDGNELTYLVDVNYWNPGDLNELHSRLSEIGNMLLDQENLPEIEPLRHWLDFTLPECHHKLEQTIFEARIKTINSQLRVNVADLVVQALQQQGFSLASSAYNEYDLHLGYGARLTNIEGNEVIVQVLPNGTGIGENELQIQSYDAEEKTEHELRRRWQEVSQSLVSYGIEVGQYDQLDLPYRISRSQKVLREKRGPQKIPIKNGLVDGN